MGLQFLWGGSDLPLLCVSHKHAKKKPWGVDKAVDVLRGMKYLRKDEAVKLEYEKIVLFVELLPCMRFSLVLMRSVLNLGIESSCLQVPFRVGIYSMHIEVVRA